jgi:WD40 repeat protein
VTVSPDGKRVAAALADGTVRIWDTDTGKEQARFAGHAGPVASVAFASDGRRIASASEDGTIRVWSAP